MVLDIEFFCANKIEDYNKRVVTCKAQREELRISNNSASEEKMRRE